MGNKLFLSHDHRDERLARALARLVGRLSLGQLEVWFSSDASPKGGLQPGVLWLDEIRSRLKESRAILVLLTPRSVERPWLLFESGFGAGLSNCDVIPVCFGLSSLSDVPYPLAMYQSFLIAGLASLRSFAVKLLGRYEIPFDGEMMNPVLRKSLTPLFKATSKIEDETGEAISIHVKSLSYADVQRGIGLLVADARQFGPDIILGINRGGAIVGGCIAKGLGLPWVYLLHVDCDRDLGGRVMENRLSESPLEGRVLLVDDAMRKGEHMREASEYILKKYSGVVLRRSVLLKMAVPHLGAERKTFRNESVDKAAFETENASLVLPWDVWGKER